jgi:hypothetical protein
MTRAERRVLALLADGEWHPMSEIRSSHAVIERLWRGGQIQGAMDGVGAWPEHRLWRLRHATPPEAPGRPAPEAAGD